MDCVTPSHPNPIPPGLSYSIQDLLQLKDKHQVLLGTPDHHHIISNDPFVAAPITSYNRANIDWLALQIDKFSNATLFRGPPVKRACKIERKESIRLLDELQVYGDENTRVDSPFRRKSSSGRPQLPKLNNSTEKSSTL